jgi:biopolymer transport protein ExbB/TolQ
MTSYGLVVMIFVLLILMFSAAVTLFVYRIMDLMRMQRERVRFIDELMRMRQAHAKNQESKCVCKKGGKHGKDK